MIKNSVTIEIYLGTTLIMPSGKVVIKISFTKVINVIKSDNFLSWFRWL